MLPDKAQTAENTALGLRRRHFLRIGMVGWIQRDDTPSPSDDLLSQVFMNNPAAAQVRWTGKRITAVTQAYPLNRSEAGTVSVQPVPSANGREALAFSDMSGSSPDVVAPLFVAPPAKALAGLGLNGQWCGLIWDDRTAVASFACDPAGIETLYIASDRTRVFFATDVRFFAALGMAGALDMQALGEFLHYLYVPSPRTAYDGVTAVIPNHILTIESNNHLSHQRRSRPRFARHPTQLPAAVDDSAFDRYLDSFELHWHEAVAAALPANGRVALLLSGGKDSSALAIALSQIAPERVVAVTVGSDQAQYDETADAAAVCAHLGMSHLTMTPKSASLFSLLPDFLDALGQPVGDPAALPLFAALRELPDDVTTVIDGTGNDAYFGIVAAAGLQRYARRREIQARIPDSLWKWVLNLMRLGPARFRSQAQEWRQPIEESFVSWHGWPPQDVARLFGFLRPLDLSETHLWRQMRANERADWRIVQTEAICGIWEPHAAYRKVVTAVRATNLRLQFPFANQCLAGFVGQLPDNIRFDEHVNKLLLRKYLARYLPQHIQQKPKGSFIFDQNRLLRHKDYRWFRELKASSAFADWDTDLVDALMTKHRNGADNLTDQVYALLLLAHWRLLQHSRAQS